MFFGMYNLVSTFHVDPYYSVQVYLMITIVYVCYNVTVNNSIVERFMIICSFERLDSKQLEYVIKDHIVMHTIILKT